MIDLPILLDLYASGRLLLDELVTARHALDDLGEAFDDMHRGRIAKGVMVFG
jgi:S-(hydroxymethyl)glutathione dehydrogenase/alcohol dehydrogenase